MQAPAPAAPGQGKRSNRWLLTQPPRLRSMPRQGSATRTAANAADPLAAARGSRPGDLPMISFRRDHLDRTRASAPEAVGPIHVLHIGLRVHIAAGRAGA